MRPIRSPNTKAHVKNKGKCKLIIAVQILAKMLKILSNSIKLRFP